MDWELIRPLIEDSARRIARSYTAWTTRSDIVSELWLWAVKNESRILWYQESSSVDEFNHLIKSILNTEARSYANREKAYMSGYDPSDVETYTPRQIRTILPSIFDVEDWQSSSTSYDGMPHAKPLANESGDGVAAIVDVRRVFEELSSDQKKILVQCYRDKAELHSIGDYFEISEDAARKRIDRAIYAMADALNNPKSGNRYNATYGQWDTRGKGRRAISNARARQITSSGWDE